MPYVCRATGHAVDEPQGGYCTDHGAPLITTCAVCGADWPVGWDSQLGFEPKGADFCAMCGFPGPWVSRTQLINWLRDRLNDAALASETRLSLQEALDRIAAMEPNDSRALAVWQQLREQAPRVWELAKPVLSTVLSAAAKRYLNIE